MKTEWAESVGSRKILGRIQSGRADGGSGWLAAALAVTLTAANWGGKSPKVADCQSPLPDDDVGRRSDRALADFARVRLLCRAAGCLKKAV